MSRFIPISSLFLVVAGCTGTMSGGADLTSAQPDLVSSAGDLGGATDLATGDMASAPAATTALVTTSALNTGPSGGINTIRLGDHSVQKAIDTTIDQDNVVRAMGGKVYILDRTNGSVRIYDPAAGFKNPIEIATGDGVAPHGKSNPHDVLAVPGSTKIYVALSGNDTAHAVGVIDSSMPAKGVGKWIAVPMAKSALPAANNLYLCGTKVYVTLADIDANFTVTGPGRIAVIDTATDALVGGTPIIALVGKNPGAGSVDGVAALDPKGACDQILVAEGGDYSPMLPNGGGIEQVDLTAGKSLGFLLTDAALSASPGTVSVASKNLAYTVVSNADYTSSVIAFDPTAKKMLSTVLGPASYVSFADVSPDGQLFVGVAKFKNGSKQPAVGVYYGPTSGALGMAPVDFGQAPYAIAFY